MAQPPALRVQRCERTLHGVLGASSDVAAPRQREPVARVHAQPARAEDQYRGPESGADAGGPETEQREPRGADGRLAGMREASVLLAARVVHTALLQRSWS